MEDYLNYMAGLVGAEAIVPIVLLIAFLGPIVVYKLVHHVHSGWLNKVKWLFAAVTFFSCLIVYIGSGGFIGGLFESPALGMGAGLVAFYYSYNGFTSLLPSTCSIETKQPQDDLK